MLCCLIEYIRVIFIVLFYLYDYEEWEGGKRREKRRGSGRWGRVCIFYLFIGLVQVSELLIVVR